MAINVYSSGGVAGTPASKLVSVSPQAGGEIAVAKQDERLGGIISGAAQMYYEQRSKAQLMQAVNEYNAAMTLEDDRLRQLKEGNAANNVDNYISTAEKTRDKILKKYSFLRHGRMGDEFNRMTFQSAMQGRNSMQQYVHAETEKQLEVEYSNGMQGIYKSIADNAADEVSFNMGLERIKQNVGVRYAGHSDEVQTAAYNKALGGAVGTRLDALLAVNDYTGADQVLKVHGGGLTADDKNRYTKTIETRMQLNKDIDYADTVARQYGYDAVKIEEAVRSGALKLPGTGSGEATVANIGRAIMGQESDGNANAVNDETGAHGLYQILPENWPEWSKQAGLGDNAERTAENQKKVFMHKMGEYKKAYGTEGAIVAWYAGPTNGQRWKDGAPDAVDGNGNHYSWDAKQGNNGDYPSVREYLEQVKERMGDSTTADPMRQKQLLAQIQAVCGHHRQIETMKHNKQVEAWAQNVAQWKNGGMSYADAMKNAEAMCGTDDKALARMQTAIKVFYNPNSVSMSAEQAGELNDMMIRGATQDEILAYCEKNNFSGSQTLSLISKNNKAINKQGAFKADLKEIKGELKEKLSNVLGIKESEVSDAMLNGAMRIVTDYAGQEMQRTGTLPSHFDLVQRGVKAATSPAERGVHFTESSAGDYAPASDFRKVEDNMFGDDVFGYTEVDYRNKGLEVPTKMVDGDRTLWLVTTLDGRQAIKTSQELEDYMR